MLERLLELGKTVLAERDLDRLLTTAIDSVIELCGAERGMILLFDPEGAVVVETARNLAREDVERPELEVSRTILERVRATGEPFWNPNVLDDPALGDRASVLRLLLLSVICQPIRDGDQILGVVYLDTRSAERIFSEETARLVASFSELISLAARNALEQRRLQQRISALSDELRGRYDFGAIVGQDPKMLAVLKLVSQVADSDATVLIGGESGTGKELVARALHFNSRRRAKPFIPVNCGALPENLLEAELFGHTRGAFTGAVRDNPGWFERAEGGTLLLDEVGELAPPLQVKLLRVLENGEYSRLGSTQIRRADVRIVAATNRALDVLVREGKVRQDFLYRLNVVEVRLPSLRERRSDLPVLIRHFLGRLGGGRGDRGEASKKLAPEAEALLLAYDWPGNIRELQNVLSLASALAGEGAIEAEHIELPETRTASAGSYHQQVEALRRRLITEALARHGANHAEAARELGLSRQSISYLIRQLRLG